MSCSCKDCSCVECACKTSILQPTPDPRMNEPIVVDNMYIVIFFSFGWC